MNAFTKKASEASRAFEIVSKWFGPLGRHPVPLRHGRGRGLSEHHSRLAQLVSPKRTGAGAGSSLDVRTIHGRPDAANLDACSGMGRHFLADGIFRLLPNRHLLVSGLCYVVSQSSP